LRDCESLSFKCIVFDAFVFQAVASLPPEQMFQLMQQMKLCIQNNPQEARTMLLQNPQLAYALLQAQVVMRCAAISTLPA
jgi:cleavage stimulation factor subunit 2